MKMKNDLLPRFLEYSRKHSLFEAGDRILAGVSGGADSMAMLDLFARIGQPVLAAHCNFSLRGKESDGDEDFVRDFAVGHSIPFLSIRFDTQAVAAQEHISVEMAARKLRYEWFESMRGETGCTAIGIAHQADDSVETMLINLIRGTGLRGLGGIQPVNGRIIRPLLFCCRSEIEHYLEGREIPYRTDTSNLDMAIIRNRIRNRILPEMEKINPGIRSMLLEEQAIYREVQALITRYVEGIRSDVQKPEGDRIKIDKHLILGSENRELLLFEILRDFGFAGRQLPAILKAMSSTPGKIFTNRSYQLLIDRDNLIIAREENSPVQDSLLDPGDPDTFLQAGLDFRILTEGPFLPPDDPGIAWLDLDSLVFPLLLRGWLPGDAFQPLGMPGKKKVSDFLIDQKIHRFDKNRLRILTSQEQIVWLTGLRIDHRFRVTEKTLRVLEISLD